MPPAPVRTLVGLLLMLPAGLALLIGYVWPSVRTGWNSLRSGTMLGDGEFVGLENYSTVLGEGGPGAAFGFALSLAGAPLLVLLVVAPLLAWAAHHAGRPVRLVVRLALTVPMVCFAPAALAIGWRLDRFDSEAAPGTVRAAVWLSLFGLLCGLGVMLYLAALRRRPDGSPAPWAAVGAVAGLLAVTVVAVALQAFTYPLAVTGGGPGRETATPLLDTYTVGLSNIRLGAGSAQAMLVLIPVMALGVGAALLLILTRFRIEIDPSTTTTPRAADERPPREPVRVVALVGALLGLVAVLAVTVYGLWPWLSRLGALGEIGAADAASMVAWTWLPPVVSTVIGVGLAAAAGFGIGALRPLGRRSELLLLPFAPWLFIGVGPLVLVKFQSAAFGPIERLDNALGMIPPVWLTVPALFLFTVLFRGLAQQPAAAGAVAGGYGRMWVRALPMVALAGGATWLVQSQSLLWSTIAVWERTAPAWVVSSASQFVAHRDAFGFGLVLPVPLIVLLAAGLAAAQLLYLDRAAIRVGRPE